MAAGRLRRRTRRLGAYVTFGYWPAACFLGPMLSLYTVAALCPLRIAVACSAYVIAVWGYGGLVGRGSSMAAVLVQAVVYCSVLVWFGTLTRRFAELTRRLRQEQAGRARRAVAEERGRIARELHDVVAHHMAVISVQAGLARFVRHDASCCARTGDRSRATECAEAASKAIRPGGGWCTAKAAAGRRGGLPAAPPQAACQVKTSLGS
ncbi:histidine kinase [Streptomyces sp. V4I2]|uniref:histidine kinase n=1 Tax=Streptomyces sp. V4I2 TaxID=3042280 RepID=UPI00277DD43B|nr:signal transduction histidine kinase [Streptomyces sp. V4I2]